MTGPDRAVPARLRRDGATIAVTGAGGLIGGAVLRRLSSSATHHVIAIARGPGPRPIASRSADIDLLGDDAAALLRDLSPDLIVHCAAAIPSGRADCDAAERNSAMDRTVFIAADQAGAAVIFCSTASIYFGSALPWHEALSVVPITAYAQAKMRSEAAFAKLANGAASLRISSPYGSDDGRRSSVLYHFARKAAGGEAIQVFGSGERTQDFIHVSDIAAAIAAIVAGWDGQSGLANRGVFNIGAGAPISMRALATLVAAQAATGSRVVIGAQPDPDDDFRAGLSIAKAEAELGWVPRVSLTQGVSELLAHGAR